MVRVQRQRCCARDAAKLAISDAVNGADRATSMRMVREVRISIGFHPLCSLPLPDAAPFPEHLGDEVRAAIDKVAATVHLWIRPVRCWWHHARQIGRSGALPKT